MLPVVLVVIALMVMVYINGKVVKNMKAIGEMEKETDREPIIG